MPGIIDPPAKDEDTSRLPNTIYIKSGSTTVEVAAHFTGDKTYEDIIKTALRREFAN